MIFGFWNTDKPMKTPIHRSPRHSLRWRHNELDGVSDHQPDDCLHNLLFRRRSKKTSKLRVTGLCAGNSPGTGEFPAQKASNVENVSIWWRHHVAVVFWRHANTYCYMCTSFWPIVRRTFPSGPRASSRRRQVDYHSLIIENDLQRYHWLACGVRLRIKHGDLNNNTSFRFIELIIPLKAFHDGERS